MGLKRAGLTALAVLVLGLAGTACQPPPQELTLHLQTSGKYEFLSSELGLTVDVACTEQELVFLRFMKREAGAWVPLADGYVVVACPGPAGATSTSWWKWGSSAPTSLTLQVRATPYDAGQQNPNWQRETSDGQTVTFTPVLCWFGHSKPCAPA